jgi:hypothetical protein
MWKRPFTLHAQREREQELSDASKARYRHPIMDILMMSKALA